MYDVLVFSGHSGCPFPGLLVQTVLLRRPRLRLQLTTLMKANTHTSIHTRQAWVNTYVVPDQHTHQHGKHTYTQVQTLSTLLVVMARGVWYAEAVKLKKSVRKRLSPSHIINTVCDAKLYCYPLGMIEVLSKPHVKERECVRMLFFHIKAHMCACRRICMAIKHSTSIRTMWQFFFRD